MNTLEHLKAEAKQWGTRDIDGSYLPDGILAYDESDIDTIVEHTHTQTIQSVREKIEARKLAEPVHSEIAKIKNRLFTDLLKDLEAPVGVDEKAIGKVQKVKDAWTVEGRVPSFHREMKAKLHIEWPVLARALEELVEGDNVN